MAKTWAITVLVKTPLLHPGQDIAQVFVALAPFGDWQFVPFLARHFTIDTAKIALEGGLLTFFKRGKVGQFPPKDG